MSSALILTQVHLAPNQKIALRKKAESKGTKIAEEIRGAIDAYLAGMDTEQLNL